MPDLFNPEALGIVSLGVATWAGVFYLRRAQRRKKPTPEQLEAGRRRWLAQHGKLGGGEILEVQERTLSYQYDVRGINYTASQDISALGDHLPPDRWSIIGGVGVRYDPRNPANSIVLCETWSGLRRDAPDRS